MLQKIQDLEYQLSHVPSRQVKPSSGPSQARNSESNQPASDEPIPNHTLTNRSDLFAGLFLDAETFKTPATSLLVPHLPLPSSVEDILHNPESDLHICQAYMTSIHKWLPMLSEKRLSQNLAIRTHLVDAPLALLLICMKLVCEQPGSSADFDKIIHSADNPHIYLLAKDFLRVIEDAHSISLRLLQSVILIAVYEIGHGIYPAAYLTVGHAATLGMMMGLHDRRHARQLFKTSDTWTLREEERRTWWSILVLDRLV